MRTSKYFWPEWAQKYPKMALSRDDYEVKNLFWCSNCHSNIKHTCIKFHDKILTGSPEIVDTPRDTLK